MEGSADKEAPNGSRVNIGIYGNTVEASKGRTSAWIHAASLRFGGWVKGTSVLHWVANNFTNGETVSVEFSPNGGLGWSTLASGLPACAGVAVGFERLHMIAAGVDDIREVVTFY